MNPSSNHGDARRLCSSGCYSRLDAVPVSGSWVLHLACCRLHLNLNSFHVLHIRLPSSTLRTSQRSNRTHAGASGHFDFGAEAEGLKVDVQVLALPSRGPSKRRTVRLGVYRYLLYAPTSFLQGCPTVVEKVPEPGFSFCLENS